MHNCLSWSTNKIQLYLDVQLGIAIVRNELNLRDLSNFVSDELYGSIDSVTVLIVLTLEKSGLLTSGSTISKKPERRWIILPCM